MTRPVPSSPDLFGLSPAAVLANQAKSHCDLREPASFKPLAEQLRPSVLAEVVGQPHLVGEDGALTRMLGRGALASLMLWGPPGVGKTTIARLLADAAGLHFAAVSAVFSGVADLKRVFEEAARRRQLGARTLLFVDEVHRFNRAQQDSFLPVVEDGTVVLVGATTENPSFALNGALLSRCQVLVLRRLDDDALDLLLARAEQAVGRPLPILPEARGALRVMADGDGRYLLNMAEQLLGLSEQPLLDASGLAAVIGRRAALHDRDRDEYHSFIQPTFTGEASSQINGLLSAFHKSLRGSDPDAALYYGARFMIYGPEMAATVFRRLACAASEDVGMADPNALVQVLTAWQAFERVGWPEGRLFIAQAITYVATAPKSNASHVAFDAAMTVAERTKSVEPPLHVLNAPTKMMKRLGYQQGYRYDHDEPHAYAGQEFFPEPLKGDARPELYAPSDRGFEREVRKRLDFWSRLKARRCSDPR